MKLSFDEICDAWDNPESASIIEVRQALKGAIEMIKQLEKENQFGYLFQSVGQWSKETFPNAQPIHHLRKLKQEADEAIADPTDIYEYCDILIPLFAAANKAGFTAEMLLNCSFKKLEILNGRTWEEQPDGTHQHKNISNLNEK